MPECIDLNERFGRTHKIKTDPAYFAETGSSTNNNRDPWFWIIPGARGHICPWGGDLLAACLNAGHTITAKRLMAEPWVDQDRSQVGEVNAVFNVKHYAHAFAYVKARRRPRNSPATTERRRKAMQLLRRGQLNVLAT